jgi:hypothetical protein
MKCYMADPIPRLGVRGGRGGGEAIDLRNENRVVAVHSRTHVVSVMRTRTLARLHVEIDVTLVFAIM